MHTEMIDRVAQAIFQAECDFNEEEPDWGRCGYKTAVSLYHALARTALEAIHEPSEQMHEGAGTVAGFDRNIDAAKTREAHTQWWQKMIDVALKS